MFEERTGKDSLTQKYEPKTFDEVVGHDDVAKKMRAGTCQQ